MRAESLQEARARGVSLFHTQGTVLSCFSFCLLRLASYTQQEYTHMGAYDDIRVSQVSP